jgi:tetratricopeptide (TPR) repeat protein
MFPENIDYTFNLAQAASELDEHEVAIANYKKVIVLDTEERQTADKTEKSYLALGMIYSEKLKDKKRAIRVYKKLLEF